jgi:uncharacterized protein (DUF427 family)
MEVKFQDTVIATSPTTVEIDGYHYFPPNAVTMSYLKESDFTSFCPFKGRARYWDIVSGDVVVRNAAFSYPTTEGDMKKIEGHIAFWPNKDTLTVS